MDEFCVAADFKTDTIDAYQQLNDKYAHKAKVVETYGQMTINNIVTGGRVHHDIPHIDILQLENYIKYSKERGIGFNYSLNGYCTGNMEFTRNGLECIYDFVKKLYNIGVTSVTVSSIAILEMIKTMFPDISVKVSIINQVNTINKLAQYKDFGVDCVVIDESVNRNFPLLKKMAKIMKIELIANSLCSKDCIFRGHHYNQTAHASLMNNEDQIITYYNYRCMLTRSQKDENILKLCWIRPEDIHFYNDIGIYSFKLQGRHTVVNGKPVEVVKCYMERLYDGNLIELLEMFNTPYKFKVGLDNKKLNGFIEPFTATSFCNSDCNSCNYCEKFLKEHYAVADFKNINSLATRFYNEMDEYKLALDKLSKKKEEAEVFAWEDKNIV